MAKRIGEAEPTGFRMNRAARLIGAGVAGVFACGLAVPGSVALADEPLETTTTTITSSGFLDVPSGFNPPTPYTVSTFVPTVEFAEVPLAGPTEQGNPWSSWGRGLVHSNGNTYVSLGDHEGIGASSYVYEYNPSTGVVRMVADLITAVDGFNPETDFGFGKIHGRLSEANDGSIHFASYWGQWNRDNHAYEGDRLFRYDPDTEELTDLGMPLFGWGYPSTHFDPERGLFYAEAAERKSNRDGDPDNDFRSPSYPPDGALRNIPYNYRFFVYDLNSDEVIFHGGHEGISHGRDFFVDADGHAYFNDGGGTLVKYNADTNELESVPGLMPGSNIRRTAGPDLNGIMYGHLADTSTIFSFDPATGQFQTIGEKWADSAALEVDPTGQYLYYIPGSHGPHTGVPVVQVDLANGSQTVLAFLSDTIWDEFNFHLGGTYSMNLTPDGKHLNILFNGKAGADSPSFDDLAFVSLTVPEPASLSLLAIGSVLLLRRRRKNGSC